MIFLYEVLRQFHNRSKIVGVQQRCQIIGEQQTIKAHSIKTFGRHSQRIFVSKFKISIIFSMELYPIVSFDYLRVQPFTVKATLDGEEPHMLMRQGDEISFYVGDDGRVHIKVGYSHVVSRSTVHDKVQAVAVREKTGVIKLYLDGVLDGGMYCNLTELSGQKAAVYNEGKVTIYNKAFPYDEI